jgi:hypothetical protein
MVFLVKIRELFAQPYAKNQQEVIADEIYSIANEHMSVY